MFFDECISHFPDQAADDEVGLNLGPKARESHRRVISLSLSLSLCLPWAQDAISVIVSQRVW